MFLASSIKIVQEVRRKGDLPPRPLGRRRGPGLFFVVPIIDRIVRVNLQIVAVPVASQAVITKDNVTSTVDAVAYFQVVDPEASVIKIRDWYSSSQLVTQTTLRSIVGRHELDSAHRKRDSIDAPSSRSPSTPRPRAGASRSTAWRSATMQVPEQLQQAMARQAEAERKRRVEDHLPPRASSRRRRSSVRPPRCIQRHAGVPCSSSQLQAA